MTWTVLFLTCPCFPHHPSKQGELVVTHAGDWRYLLTVPPVLPEQKFWVGLAGAAVNDWVREQGMDKARAALHALSTPVPKTPRHHGKVRKYCGNLVSRIFAFFSSLARR